jgi:hypothetical protein
MAIRKDITIQGEATLDVKGAKVSLGSQSVVKPYYIKVTNVSGDKAIMLYTVSFTTEGSQPHGDSFSFEPSCAEGSDNFIKQAYEHLKTLPEFTGATDV